MAIINSMGVGRSRKSMGNVTYRVVRGRTIGSQKRVAGVTGATTRGISGNVRKPLFAMINTFMAAHQSDIQVSFNKSRYGSQRNYFFSINYKALSAALNTLALSAAASGIMPLESEVEAAIVAYATANPTAIYRVKLAGFENLFLTGAWSSDDNPVSGGSIDGLGNGVAKVTSGEYKYNAPATLSLSKHSGARIVHAAGTVLLTGSAIPSGLTAETIIYHTVNGPINPAVVISDVESAAGSVQYTAPEITEAENIVAVQLGTIFFRLSSAYVQSGGSNIDDDPLG